MSVTRRFSSSSVGCGPPTVTGWSRSDSFFTSSFINRILLSNTLVRTGRTSLPRASPPRKEAGRLPAETAPLQRDAVGPGAEAQDRVVGALDAGRDAGGVEALALAAGHLVRERRGDLQAARRDLGPVARPAPRRVVRRVAAAGELDAQVEADGTGRQ